MHYACAAGYQPLGEKRGHGSKNSFLKYKKQLVGGQHTYINNNNLVKIFNLQQSAHFNNDFNFVERS